MLECLVHRLPEWHPPDKRHTEKSDVRSSIRARVFLYERTKTWNQNIFIKNIYIILSKIISMHAGTFELVERTFAFAESHTSGPLTLAEQGRGRGGA